MRVMVLGAGPAGLMAAQAVVDAHLDVLKVKYGDDMTAIHRIAEGDLLNIAIISRKQKSPLYGAQYLHRPIPRVTPPSEVAVSYQMRGSTDDYRRKVYGQLWDGIVSPEDLDEEHHAWDIRATYDALWRLWEGSITDGDLDPISLRNLINDPASTPDLIINSIPRPVLCHAGHNFGATEIWAAGSAPELGIRIPYICPPNMVVCNGEDNPSWYRMSNVFDRTTVEWPGSLRVVPITTASRVKKPTSNNCNCWEDSPVPVMHVGRYGTWEKGVLSHTAYFGTYSKIQSMMGVGNATAEAEA